MIVDQVRRVLAGRRARWDAICRRCGRCCYEKEIRGLSAPVTNYRHPCAHLDTLTRTCTVYENRFAACAECRRMTLWHAFFVRWLPESCGYVQHYRVWARPRSRTVTEG
ncbi:MAG TPA: hypothetical protein VFB30_05795 [Spirochaetia bacterium]|nr:hypothetical protein [Spirochaetia bacterium]